jgi:hypothetical protein
LPDGSAILPQATREETFSIEEEIEHFEPSCQKERINSPKQEEKSNQQASNENEKMKIEKPEEKDPVQNLMSLLLIQSLLDSTLLAKRRSEILEALEESEFERRREKEEEARMKKKQTRVVQKKHCKCCGRDVLRHTCAHSLCEKPCDSQDKYKQFKEKYYHHEPKGRKRSEKTADAVAVGAEA